MTMILCGLIDSLNRSLAGQLKTVGIMAETPMADQILASAGKFAGTDDRVIWLYVPPWKLSGCLNPGETPGQALQHWLDTHRRLLNQRRHLGRNLMLINADRVPFAQICRKLASDEGVSEFEVETAEHSPEAGNAGGLDGFLAKAFEWSNPEYWDVLEMLESLAWIPEGSPMFRDQIPVPAPGTVTGIFDALLRPSSRFEPEPDMTGLDSVQRERDEARDEAELLLLQLHQVQEELESLYLEGQASRQKSESEKQELIASLEALRQQAADQSATEGFRVELEQMSGQLDEARAESELLLLQLHQVQEELESLYLQGQDQQRQFEAERQELKASQEGLNRSLSDLAAERQQQLDAARHEAGALSASRDLLSRELVTLQQRLQQVEAEREQRANQAGEHEGRVRELSARLEQLGQQAESARLEASALAASRESLSQELAALRQRFQQTETDREQYARQAAEHESRVRELAARLEQVSQQSGDLQGENELLLLQLHQVQEELEHYYLENQTLNEVLNRSTALFERARLVMAGLMGRVSPQASSAAGPGVA